VDQQTPRPNGGASAITRLICLTKVDSFRVTTAAATTVARAPKCQNPAAAVIAGRKAAPETKWPRHFDPLHEGVAVPAGKCLWVDWDATDAEVVQVQTALGWVDLNVAEGWYLDDKLTCPAPGKMDIGPPA
jgi:hypothetical protein